VVARPMGRTITTSDYPLRPPVDALGVGIHVPRPIESTFATVRLRQRITKGPGSRAAGIAMAFKLIESAQTRWRAVNAGLRFSA